MLFTSMYYTRAEQPSRISAWYLFNGIGVAGGGLIGYGIGHIKGALASWRLEFLIVGAVCALWGVVIALTLANSPLTSRWFSREEKVMMLARMRRNQTGIESKRIRWGQVREAVLDYKTVSPSSVRYVAILKGIDASARGTLQWMFFSLGLVGNIPNGGISNVSALDHLVATDSKRHG
jgi:MFS family permease